MTEGKERSLLFKVLYRVMSILFFPIILVLYFLKHPLWVFGVLFIAVCGLLYYPMSMGVKFDDVPMWYKNKYTEVKIEVVSAAVEKGHGDMFSEDMLKDLADEEEEKKGLKSEGYNAKIARDEVMKEKTVNIKKRGGFKRKGDTTTVSDGAQQTTSETESNKAISGGLEAIFQVHSRDEANVRDESVSVRETEEEEVSKSPEVNVIVPELTLPQTSEKDESDTELDEFGLF